MCNGFIPQRTSISVRIVYQVEKSDNFGTAVLQTVNELCPMSAFDQSCSPRSGSHLCDTTVGNITAITFRGYANSSAGSSGTVTRQTFCN